jgi:hypothetical protein
MFFLYLQVCNGKHCPCLWFLGNAYFNKKNTFEHMSRQCRCQKVNSYSNKLMIDFNLVCSVISQDIFVFIL